MRAGTTFIRGQGRTVSMYLDTLRLPRARQEVCPRSTRASIPIRRLPCGAGEGGRKEGKVKQQGRRRGDGAEQRRLSEASESGKCTPSLHDGGPRLRSPAWLAGSTGRRAPRATAVHHRNRLQTLPASAEGWLTGW